MTERNPLEHFTCFTLEVFSGTIKNDIFLLRKMSPYVFFGIGMAGNQTKFFCVYQSLILPVKPIVCPVVARC